MPKGDAASSQRIHIIDLRGTRFCAVSWPWLRGVDVRVAISWSSRSLLARNRGCAKGSRGSFCGTCDDSWRTRRRDRVRRVSLGPEMCRGCRWCTSM